MPTRDEYRRYYAQKIVSWFFVMMKRKHLFVRYYEELHNGVIYKPSIKTFERTYFNVLVKRLCKGDLEMPVNLNWDPSTIYDVMFRNTVDSVAYMTYGVFKEEWGKCNMDKLLRKAEYDVYHAPSRILYMSKFRLLMWGAKKNSPILFSCIIPFCMIVIYLYKMTFFELSEDDINQLKAASIILSFLFTLFLIAAYWLASTERKREINRYDFLNR